MSTAVLYMSMSVDGCIAGPNDDPGNPGGDGFERFHRWLFEDDVRPRTTGVAGAFYEEINATGAVVTGRRTAEQAGHWRGDHHGVPVFVPSHRPPNLEVADFPLVEYVSDGVEGAIRRAKEAAGDRNVMVHGASTARGALEAGLIDEIQIHLIPVLFGNGRKLFDVLPSQTELEILRVIDDAEATHIRYRVLR